MAKKKISLTEQETQMIERLRGRPALSKRFEAILDLSDSEQGAVKTADEIEALPREEIRRLGHTTMEPMGRWGREADWKGIQRESSRELLQKNG